MKKLALIIAAAAGFSSCTTDFDLTADYKEVLVMWGLLSQNDTTHYIRIQKAFLDENTSALLQAQDPDSIYYPDVLVVTVEQIGTGNKWTLERIDGDTLPEPIKKDSGTFASSPNILYRFTTPLTQSASYRITIENLASGLIATATTPLIQDFQVLRPVTSINANFIGSSDFKAIWKVAANSSIYDLKIRLKFGLADDNQPLTIIKDTFVDLPIFSGRSYTGTDAEFAIPTEVFYDAVKNNMQPAPGFVRHFEFLDFIFSVGSTELGNYVNFNQAQTGLTSNQISVQYSNVDNGLGLFASRFTKIVPDVPMTEGSLDTLACGQKTGHLNFAPSQNHTGYPFCQ